MTRLLTGAGRVPRPAARGLASALEAAGQHGAAATGVQVLAPWWQEARVLATMAAIEARVDGVPAPPDPCYSR